MTMLSLISIRPQAIMAPALLGRANENVSSHGALFMIHLQPFYYVGHNSTDDRVAVERIRSEAKISGFRNAKDR
eukprot:scaffold29471_cov21-Prasinocladus_malaysianus.AAC.1